MEESTTSLGEDCYMITKLVIVARHRSELLVKTLHITVLTFSGPYTNDFSLHSGRIKVVLEPGNGGRNLGWNRQPLFDRCGQSLLRDWRWLGFQLAYARICDESGTVSRRRQLGGSRRRQPCIPFATELAQLGSRPLR